MRRRDVSEYHPVALREALVNAVAHADYSQHGMPIRVAVFDDRLEIENPGGWPPGMTEENMRAGISRVRNPVIARVLHEFDYMERWGSGYRRIREACEPEGYPLPSWQEIGPVLRTHFVPHPQVAAVTPTRDVGVNVLISDRQQWFLDQVASSKRVSATELADHFGITTRTAERDIEKLRDAGVVEFMGPPKTGRYQIVE